MRHEVMGVDQLRRPIVFVSVYHKCYVYLRPTELICVRFTFSFMCIYAELKFSRVFYPRLYHLRLRCSRWFYWILCYMLFDLFLACLTLVFDVYLEI